ncbi:MAG: multicopper oxidase domain-containing protein [Desulfobacterales bacterium]|nr:multicopper oxidase domain-containing protein [Desulfobacterales bacterium]
MINRRQFLYLAGAGAANLFNLNALPLTKAAAAASDKTDFSPDVELSLTASPSEARIFPGQPTTVWQYSGQVIKGDSNSLLNLENSYLGPIIRVRQHQKVRIHFKNDLPARSIIHWHGLHVPASMDGHPKDVISTGETFTYEFEVLNRAGTYWYHPHPHGRTGHQVYGGLAGLFLVSDAEEKKLNLPKQELDIPLVIQDRAFNRDNQLVYLPRGMHDSMTGMLGDSICVNGQPDFKLSVSTRAYRLRILNGSNSRIYKLAWSDGTPLTVIATDGGLLEKPIEKKYVVLGPAERIELWADFSKYPVGTSLELVSKYFEAAMQGSGMGPRRGMTPGEMLPNGAPFSVLKIDVARKEIETHPRPQKLSAIERYLPQDADNRDHPRQFSFFMRHMHGLINGRTFRMQEVANDERVRLNSTELWELANDDRRMGMMMMPMPHPVHLHGKPFQVIERSGVLHSGYVDEGWKDTVLLMPGERARIVTNFSDYAGLFLYHCHILEHGDMGMMRNYLVS